VGWADSHPLYEEVIFIFEMCFVLICVSTTASIGVWIETNTDNVKDPNYKKENPARFRAGFFEFFF
jgi:hypothetical protein